MKSLLKKKKQARRQSNSTLTFGCTKSLRNHTHAANHKKRAGAIQPDLSAQEPSGGVSRSSFDTTPRQSANSNTKGPRNLRNADLSLAGAKLEIRTIQRVCATALSIKSGFRFATIRKHRP
jgi:hypothetical protein